MDKLWSNARYFQNEINKMGFNTGNTQTPIIPVMVGDAFLAQEFSRRLFSQGVFALPLGYPIVPRGKARLRVMISAAHKKVCLDYGLEAFVRIGKDLGLVS